MAELAFFPSQQDEHDAALLDWTDMRQEPLTDHVRQLGFQSPAAPRKPGHADYTETGAADVGAPIGSSTSWPCNSSTSKATAAAATVHHDSAAAHGSESLPDQLRLQYASEDGRSAAGSHGDDDDDDDSLKAAIVSHPLYPQLQHAHVLCVSAGLPPDCAKNLASQLLVHQHSVATKYVVRGQHTTHATNRRRELDHFMESYLQQLLSLKKQLEDLLIPQMESTTNSLFSIEKELWELTDNDLYYGGERISCETKDWGSLEHYEVDEMDLDPLVNAWDTNTKMQDVSYDELDMKLENQVDQKLLHCIRDELKDELKQSYFGNITSMREEILKKRRAGKLQGDIAVLQKWWNAHSKWPYPTEEEKRQMVEASGLDLRQVNNWFINHRKRNWAGQAGPM